MFFLACHSALEERCFLFNGKAGQLALTLIAQTPVVTVRDKEDSSQGEAAALSPSL